MDGGQISQKNEILLGKRKDKLRTALSLQIESK